MTNRRQPLTRPYGRALPGPWLAVLALLGSLWLHPAQADDRIVKLVSDPYPPYVLDEESQNKGYITDMALKILHDAGYQAQYINVPYNRALMGMEKGLYDGLLAVSPGRENYLYPEKAFGTSQTAFFVVKTSAWRWQGPDSLSALTLGVIEGYQLGDATLDAYIAQHRANPQRIEVSYGINALEKNLRMMALGRIGTVAEDSAVFWYTASQLGLRDKFKAAGNLGNPEPITIGFHASNPRARELASVISKGIERLKASGAYQEIMNHYGLLYEGD